MLNHLEIHSRSDSPDAINSIRRSATTASGSEANDVSLLWRHSSWVHSRTLERAYGRPFDGFGEFEPPKCWQPSCGPQKGTSLRHNACFEPPLVKFHARVTSVGESGKKIKIKIKKIYFTYFARRSLTADWHKFWVTCLSRGRNQLCKVLS